MENNSNERLMRNRKILNKCIIKEKGDRKVFRELEFDEVTE